MKTDPTPPLDPRQMRVDAKYLREFAQTLNVVKDGDGPSPADRLAAYAETLADHITPIAEGLEETKGLFLSHEMLMDRIRTFQESYVRHLGRSGEGE